jgi:hypothetical protein
MGIGHRTLQKSCSFMIRMALSEMKGMCGIPLCVRSTEGMGFIARPPLPA